VGEPDAGLVVLARLGAPYGIKGWMRLWSDTSPPENILGYRHWYLGRNGNWQEQKLEEIRPHGRGLVVKLEGCNTPEAARLYTNAVLAVPAADMPELDEGEYYWHELLGMKVLARQDSGEVLLLGCVHELMETGANDVIVVRACEGSIDRRERLIPWLLDQVVLAVDAGAREILVDWAADF